MPTGKVKFYDEEKGFGFVTSDDGQEVFLHASALRIRLHDGIGLDPVRRPPQFVRCQQRPLCESQSRDACW